MSDENEKQAPTTLQAFLAGGAQQAPDPDSDVPVGEALDMLVTMVTDMRDLYKVAGPPLMPVWHNGWKCVADVVEMLASRTPREKPATPHPVMANGIADTRKRLEGVKAKGAEIAQLERPEVRELAENSQELARRAVLADAYGEVLYAIATQRELGVMAFEAAAMILALDEKPIKRPKEEPKQHDESQPPVH